MKAVKIILWSFLAIFGLVLVLGFISAIPGVTALLAGAGFLIAGWAFYLARVLPQLVYNPAMIFSGLLAYLVALYLGHRLLKWFSNQRVGLPNPWQWRLSFFLSLILLSSFGTAIAMTGIVHQSAWLFSAPIIVDRSIGMFTFQAHQARQIGVLLLLYEQDHGKLPETLIDLRDGGYTDMGDDFFLCPYESGNYEPWLYLGAGKKFPESGNTPLLVSPRPVNGRVVYLRADSSVQQKKTEDLPPEVAQYFQAPNDF